ncbi:MAG: hypothetical protein EBY55_01770 [Gammaproteobacteria bacterium]|nr:hypothetical protein [Gammaproteobacteria bacterium]
MSRFKQALVAQASRKKVLVSNRPPEKKIPNKASTKKASTKKSDNKKSLYDESLFKRASVKKAQPTYLRRGVGKES